MKKDGTPLDLIESRKVIQIAFDNPLVFALCDDGTIWWHNFNSVRDVEWVPVQPIPQGNVEWPHQEKS